MRVLAPLAVAAMLAPLLAGCVQPPAGLSVPDLPVPLAACAHPATRDARGHLVGGCNARVAPGPKPANEPSLAISPLDPRILVAGANDYNQARPWCGVYRSEDGGASWSAGFLPGYPGDAPGALTGFDGCGDAALAFAPDGTLYYAGIAFRRGAAAGSAPVAGGLSLSYNEGASLFVARSPDAGRTWDSIVLPQRGQGDAFALATPAAGGGVGLNPAFHDKEFIAVAPDGTVVMTWTHFASVGAAASGAPALPGSGLDQATIKLTESRDRGATWSEPLELSAPGTLNQGSIPVVAPDGTLTVAWRQDAPGANDTRIVAVTRPPGGAFQPPVRLGEVHAVKGTHFTRSSSMPTLAVEPAGAPRPGRLLAAWAGNQTGDADVYASQSLDHGATWSPPVRVNQDAPGNGRDQVFPWAAIGPDGIGHVLFLDGRDDAANRLLAAYLASERPGGGFREAVLGDAPFLASQDGFSGTNFLGDYLAAAASPLGVFALWPDTRSAVTEAGDTDLYLGVLPAGAHAAG